MTKPSRIFVLTGSGISAESGISTYRGGADGDEGLWSEVDFQKYASPEGFAEDPEGVHHFYNVRRKQVREVQPNPAHFALAKLQASLRQRGGDLTLVTQNVDDLHERAGAEVLHMHGEILKGICDMCARPAFVIESDLHISDGCDVCGRVGALRPDVVWFGEMPYHMEAIDVALSKADLFVSIGTSGAVYPAAGFVQEARMRGIRTMELNLEPSDNAYAFDAADYGKAGDVVPRWAAQWSVSL
ncbi:MAG: NAD-dependent deacylase [Pseudomonadota bacterium]